MSQLAIQKKEVVVAKELGDVMDLVAKVVEDAREGKSAGEIISGNVQLLIVAITGAQDIDDEVAENREAALNTVALGMSRIAAAFFKSAKKEEGDGGVVAVAADASGKVDAPGDEPTGEKV